MRMGEGIAAMDGEDLARRMQNIEEGIRNLHHIILAAHGLWSLGYHWGILMHMYICMLSIGCGDTHQALGCGAIYLGI